MIAGQGAPDISTDVARQHGRSWLGIKPEDALPWENYLDGVKAAGQVPGYEGTYTYAPGIQTLMLFYNPEIFEQLGIEVPEDNQFTQAEFVDVVKKCNDAGYAGVADAVETAPSGALHDLGCYGELDRAKSRTNMTSEGILDTPEAAKC
jgi:ABC-type glycerol-3-phosphate transport system substrate-binding protein